MAKTYRLKKKRGSTKRHRGGGGKWFGFKSSNKEKKNTPPPAAESPAPPAPGAPQFDTFYPAGSYPAGNYPFGFFSPAIYFVNPPMIPGQPPGQPIQFPSGSAPPGTYTSIFFPNGFLSFANGFIPTPTPAASASPAPLTSINTSGANLAAVETFLAKKRKEQGEQAAAWEKGVKSVDENITSLLNTLGGTSNKNAGVPAASKPPRWASINMSGLDLNSSALMSKPPSAEAYAYTNALIEKAHKLGGLDTNYKTKHGRKFVR